MVAGAIELTVGDAVRLLTEGEAYYFDSLLPHRFRNVCATECVIVSANAPPSFSVGGEALHHR